MNFKDFKKWCLSEDRRKKTIEIYIHFLSKLPEELFNKPKELKKHIDKNFIKPSVKRQVYMSVKNYYKFLDNEKAVEIFKLPKFRGKIKTLYLSPEQYRKVLSVCNKFEYLLVKFMVETGFRRATVLLIKPKDIDVEKQIINIPHYYEGNKAKINITKKISPVLLEDLQKYIKKNKISANKRIFVIRSSNGSPLKNQGEALKHLISKIGKKAGYSWVTPHICRHTFATIRYKITKDLKSVAHGLGQLTTSSSERYSHLIEDEEKIQKKMERELYEK